MASLWGWIPPAPSGQGAHRSFSVSSFTTVGARLITISLSLSEWATDSGDARMTMALPDRLGHRSYILETGNGSLRFKANSEFAVSKKKVAIRSLTPA